MKIDGICKKGFERVAEAFTKNFAEKGELGASVCVTAGGETVVDLWGGVADGKTKAPWKKDTLSIVFSCTKGATALCAHMLASRGKLDIDAPVTELWPEFGQKGKEAVTTRMMLDHSSAVPALRAKVKDTGPLRVGVHDPAPRRGGAVLGAGHAQRLSRPHLRLDGGRDGARASGKSLGTFFQDEMAKPLGLDFWIGLPEAIEPRVAPMTPYRLQARTGGHALPARPRDRQAIDPRALLFQRRRNPRWRAEYPCGPRRRDRRSQRHHQRARPRRHVRAAGQQRFDRGGGKLVDAENAGAHGRGLDGDA